MASSNSNSQPVATRLSKLLVGAMLALLAMVSSSALGLDWLDFGHEGRDWGEAVSMSGDHLWISATEGHSTKIYYFEGNGYQEFHWYDEWQDGLNQVSFSYDGSVYVIANSRGYPPGYPPDRVGSVEAIATASGDPTPLGQVLYGEEGHSSFGHSVDISGDGTTLVVGAPYYYDPVGDRSGRAYVYRFQASTSSWEMLGAPIDGGVLFGKAVSVNYDGSRIIVGAEGSPFGGTVFNWDSQSESWMQMGSSLSVGCFGSEVSVAINALGDTAAVALSKECGGSNGGRVGVFRWDVASSEWTSFGQIIEGEANEVIAKPKLNFDASTLAIAGKGFSNGEGRVRVFDFDNGSATWAQKGTDITDRFRNPTGYDIDMGIDGEFLIYGYHKANNLSPNQHQPKRSETSRNKHEVSASVTPGGTISARDLTRIPSGGVFLVEPNSDWVSTAITSVTGSCPTRALGSTVFVGTVESACDINVEYQYALEVTPVTTDGGSISPATTQVLPVGGYVVFEVISDEGFTLSAVSGTCPGELVGATFTVGPVTEKCSVEPSFERIQYTISNLGGAEASLTWRDTPGGPLYPGDSTVPHGENRDFTATINDGYRMVDYTGSCPKRTSGYNPVTPPFGTRYISVGPISSDCTVSIETVKVHEISAVTTGQGSVSPSDIRYVDAGDYTDFRLTPAAGWVLVSVGAGLDDDCSGVLAENVFRVGPAESDCLVRAFFEPTQHTVEVLPAQGGSLNPNTNQTVDYGSTVAFTAVPDEGKNLSGYTSTCTVVPDGNVLTVGPITASCSLEAQFDTNRYTVAVRQSGSPADVQIGGTVSPSENQVIDWGGLLTFTITPESQVNFSVGGSCEGVLNGFEYTVGPINANCQVDVVFNKYQLVQPILEPDNFYVWPAEEAIIYPGGDADFVVSANTRRVVTGVSDDSTCLNVEETREERWTVRPNDWGIEDRTCQVAWDSAVTWLVDHVTTDGGRISPPENFHLPGTKIRNSAIARSGYVFDAWGGTCSGTAVGDDWEIEVGEEDCTVTASFNKLPSGPTISRTEYGDSMLRLYISEGDDGGDPDSYVLATCVGPTGRAVEAAIEGAGTFGSDSAHVAEFPNLTNGTEYACSAITYNSAGASPESNTVRETPRGKPFTPVITEATAGFSKIVLDFEADNRGAEIESLTYECSNLTRETVTAEANVTEATVELHRLIIEGLPNAQTYTCSIAVSNSEGTSPMSAPSAAVTTGKVCDQENLSFSSQAELDSFTVDCSEITGHLSLSNVSNIEKLSVLTDLGGDLRIRNTQITDVSDLSGLRFGGGTLEVRFNENMSDLSGFSSLTSLQGDLLIDDGTLQSLSGLDNLASVGGSVYLSSMSSLTSLQGLGSLASVGGDFDLAGAIVTSFSGLQSLASVPGNFAASSLPELQSMSGLENLSYVGGRLYVGDNPKLTTLSGLDSLQTLGDELVLYNNPALVNIDALGELNSIGGGAQISNAALTDINAFINLESFEGSFVVTDNPALRNLDGLFSLTDVSGSLLISNNDALRTLDGLGNIGEVGLDFTVTENSTLGNCAGAAALLGYPSGPPDDMVGGDITFSGNAAGCNSITAVLDSVQGISKPVITSAVAGNNSVTLTYTASAGDAAFPIKEYTGVCVGADFEFAESPSEPILDNQLVERSFSVSGYDPSTAAPDVTLDLNISHDDPIELSVDLISPSGTVVSLWDKEDTSDTQIVASYEFRGDEIFPGESADGAWKLRILDDETGPLAKEGVLNSWGMTLREEHVASSTDTSMTFTGLTNGRTYSCSVTAKSNLNSYPASDSIEVMPVAPPAVVPPAPSIMRIDAEDGEVSVWIDVADDGGGTITEYRATCTDGTNTFVGTSTTNRVLVTGLSNDVPYTCTASITTEAGTSEESAESPPVIPEEAMSGLPVWLLYEASKPN